MTIDPTRIHVESHSVPVWEREETFQDIMNEQLKHAPWLGLSILIHAVALMLLFLLLPESGAVKPDVILKATPEKQEEEIEEEEEPPPEEEAEEVEEEFVEEEVFETEEITEEIIEEDITDTVESAFESDQWNTAIGLGGGAGGKWGGRRGGRRALGRRKRGTARAIDLGLQWLRDHQDEDGKWDCDGFMKHDKEGPPCDGAGNAVHDVGMTGLALLAFLGDGSTMKSGPYKSNVKEAVKWLIDQQDPNTGLFGTNASHDFIYNHAIAAYAMCEAQGLSRSSVLKRYAQKGINYLESHRNPYAVWRYQPRDNDNDMSVTGWCIMAYKSAKDFGLQVNEQALKIAANWMDEMTDPTNGRTGYTKRGEQSSRHPGDHATRFPPEKGEALTGVGLFCRFFLGQDPDEHDIMDVQADLILSKPPKNLEDGSIDHYYWYYATYALYQMGGRHWREWQRALTPAVVKTQRMDGNFKGSWDPNGAWGEDGGRVYSTAILVLTLEAYYRYSRLVR